ncbi:M48 family metallopeptidase [Pelagibacterales bacterium SAG-MED03]|nr:M48 family metallopeptidase [Pelagibacterales bacterium SAG-MED03]
MDFLDKYKYHKDDPREFGIEPKDLKKDSSELDNNHLSNLLTNSVRVSKEILPKVGSAIETVFDRIKIENNFNFFVTADNNQANASCSLMSSASRPDIVLTSRLIELLSLEELQFVIGHEVAHYVYQHALYPNHNNVEDRNLKLNILNLSRAAEISADRIGFLACANLDASLKANFKLASGLSDKHFNFKPSTYLDQLRDLEDLGKSSSELWSTHPSFLIRMQSLIWFSMSKEYHEFFDKKKKGSYSLSEIDEKLDSKIKKITGDELENSNKRIYESALIWGSLDIYLSDKKFSKDEQEEFSNRFGEKAKKAISLMKISNARSMLDKKIDTSFNDASKLLKTEKNKLVEELKTIGKETGGDKMKKLKILGKLLNILGIKKPVSF